MVWGVIGGVTWSHKCSHRRFRCGVPSVCWLVQRLKKNRDGVLGWGFDRGEVGAMWGGGVLVVACTCVMISGSRQGRKCLFDTVNL